MSKIRETDLILQDGAVYHLGIRPENLSGKIITVGDPDRVSEVSRHFDSVEFTHRHREFVTHTGHFKGKRLTAISTGMGTDNIEILMTELDALVNVDLQSREVKHELKSLEIVRVGTSGSLQPEIPVDSILVSELAVGFDALMCFYPYHLRKSDLLLSESLQHMADLPFLPYIVRANSDLLNRLGKEMVPGNTLTCPGFYAPQGRSVRLSPRRENLLKAYKEFRHGDFRITNFEMETAGYYAMGELLGHQMLSVNAIVASRANNVFSKNPAATVEKAIQIVLEAI
jgi:uridine phosphorylase